MKTYQGSCHCGAVAYMVNIETDFTEGMRCNCSHCRRKGFLLAFAPDRYYGEEMLKLPITLINITSITAFAPRVAFKRTAMVTTATKTTCS